MGIQYRITYEKKFYKDINLIELRTTHKHYKKLKDKMNIAIQNLQFMPRTHKTIYTLKDPIGEYRRIVLEKYSIIYKIVNNEIIILRIFNQKKLFKSKKIYSKRKISKIFNKNIKQGVI